MVTTCTSRYGVSIHRQQLHILSSRHCYGKHMVRQCWQVTRSHCPLCTWNIFSNITMPLALITTALQRHSNYPLLVVTTSMKMAPLIRACHTTQDHSTFKKSCLVVVGTFLLNLGVLHIAQKHCKYHPVLYIQGAIFFVCWL